VIGRIGSWRAVKYRWILQFGIEVNKWRQSRYKGSKFKENNEERVKKVKSYTGKKFGSYVLEE
jgi:hypothetical protein